MRESKPAEWTWAEAAPGLWSLALGETDPFSPVERFAAPRMAALRSLPTAARPDVADDLHIERAGQRLVISHPLAPDEAIGGLGLQFFKLNQRGRTRYLRVNSDPRQDTGESHAPVPFYVSSRGYGLFVDTTRIVTVCCGSVVRRREEIAVNDRNADRGWRATPFSNRLEIVLP
ncbi:MAG TPA: ABC transporter substrate-binding protein, partial [Limnochordia bacterium]|nr:ABC transporter substrate-binding protein [Limnochordia bacterium]